MLPDMNERIIAAAAKADTLATTDSKIYQLSMPLFAAGLTKNRRQFDDVLKRMQAFLNFESVDTLEASIGEHDLSRSKTAWMLGRVLIAAQELGGRDDMVAKLQPVLFAFLQQPDMPKDAMSGWAWAYLLASRPEWYIEHQRELTEATERAQTTAEGDPSTLLWTLTMNLYAAAKAEKLPAVPDASASAGDADDVFVLDMEKPEARKGPYKTVLGEFKTLTGKDNWEDIVSLVPQSDFRNWMVNTLRLAAVIQGDNDTLKALEPLWQSNVDNARYQENRMLAHATEEVVEPLRREAAALDTVASGSAAGLVSPGTDGASAAASGPVTPAPTPPSGQTSLTHG